MRGDWYLSGDLGYRDQESYIYLVDRVKDMIVSGGENIYSTEVEDALATIPRSRRWPSSAFPTRAGASRSTRSCSAGRR